MRNGLWLPPTIPIPVATMIAITIPMVVRTVQGNGGCLSSSAVGIQNAYTLRMLVPGPVCDKDIHTVLEGTTNIHQPSIHQ